jgi:hypothetical protein
VPWMPWEVLGRDGIGILDRGVKNGNWRR